jgi:hypothetical protein
MNHKTSYHLNGFSASSTVLPDVIFLAIEIHAFRNSVVDRLLIKHDRRSSSIYNQLGMGYPFTVHNFAGRWSPLAAERTGAQFHPPVWRDSPSVCALADDQRHLGHIVRAGNRWLAFDATHVNEAGTGFRLLGCWMDIALAKCAVELTIEYQCGAVSRLQ